MILAEKKVNIKILQLPSQIVQNSKAVLSSVQSQGSLGLYIKIAFHTASRERIFFYLGVS